MTVGSVLKEPYIPSGIKAHLLMLVALQGDSLIRRLRRQLGADQVVAGQGFTGFWYVLTSAVRW